QHLDRIRFAPVAPPVGADGPRAEAHFAHLDARITEFAVLHSRAWYPAHLAGVIGGSCGINHSNGEPLDLSYPESFAIRRKPRSCHEHPYAIDIDKSITKRHIYNRFC